MADYGTIARGRSLTTPGPKEPGPVTGVAQARSWNDPAYSSNPSA